MELIEYINNLSPEQRPIFAASCKTSIGYLRKACSIGQLLSPELCVAIEQESGRKVVRQTLRPDDWQRIWPELAEKAAA